MELKEEKEPETEYAPVAVTNPTLSPRPFQGVRWGYELRGWLGLVPFLLFCLLFEILPVVIILEGSFTDSTTGALTLNNYQRIFSQTRNLGALQTSISLALITALVGAVVGFLVAYGVSRLRIGWLHHFLMGFSRITANLAGVPLAFAFVATLGVNGLMTVGIHKLLRVNLYDIGFNLYTIGGLVIVYSYFQLPLMILLIVPALHRLRQQWREAATNLGASGFTYWRRVALPIVMPSLLAATLLLFVNAFGSYATAAALTQGAINLAPILIGLVVTGSAVIDTGSANALAVGMIVILLAAVWLATTLVPRPASGQVSETMARAPSPSTRRSLSLNNIILVLVALCLLIPPIASLAFSFSNGTKIDFSAFHQLFSDNMFKQSLVHSLEMAFATAILTIVLVTPTAYWVHHRVPQARSFLHVLTLIPFVVPAIIMSLGLVELYGTSNPLADILSLGLVPLLSAAPFHIVNTPQLLVCAYVILSLPFVYRFIENSLRAINTTALTEAAYSQGSGWWRAFLTVIVPNIWPGVMSAALLTFSMVMGEFTLASLFGVFTFPVYLNATGQENPHKAAFLALLSFLFTLISVLGIIFLLRRRVGRTEPEGEIGIVASK
jgi:ABC-type uncharacterized transport system permease subunit